MDFILQKPISKIPCLDSTFQPFFNGEWQKKIDFIEIDVFLTNMFKIQKRWKNNLKNMPSDPLVVPTPHTRLFFNCRLNVTYK